jgi:hypothetical protein
MTAHQYQLLSPRWLELMAVEIIERGASTQARDL